MYNKKSIRLKIISKKKKTIKNNRRKYYDTRRNNYCTFESWIYIAVSTISSNCTPTCLEAEHPADNRRNYNPRNRHCSSRNRGANVRWRRNVSDSIMLRNRCKSLHILYEGMK